MNLEIRYYLTATINEVMLNNKAMADAIRKAVDDFTSGNYGLVPKEDAEANKEDLSQLDGHVLGRYETPEGNIYINMTFDQEQGKTYGQALVMFCNEY